MASYYVSFNCKFCGLTFSTKQEIKQHVKHKHSCNVSTCNFVFTDSVELLKHIVGAHFPILSVYNNCMYCNKMFGTTASLAQHTLDKHEVYIDAEEDETTEKTVEIHCQICPKYYCLNTNTFANHMTNKHPQILLSCPYLCQFNTNKFWEFSSHLQEHMTKEVLFYECPGCSGTFPKYKSVVQHFRDKNRNGDYDHSGEVDDYIASVVKYCTLCNHEYEMYYEDEEDYFESEFYNHIGYYHGIIIPYGIQYI